MPEIDFLIIGAQKGGTTSLFEYMRRHPRIHMPAKKEIEFFNRDHAFARGWSWYLAEVTRGAQPDAICGEASTYYMSGRPGDMLAADRNDLPDISAMTTSLEEVIPRRIQEYLPDARLICVLRDPVARAYSAYRMMALERTESRSFEDAISELLSPVGLERARLTPTMTNGYVVMGEYHRILAGFLRVFPPEQLMIIFTDDLSISPADTISAVFSFIGAEADFIPDNLTSRYREAAVKERIPGLHLVKWQADIARMRSARTLWHALPRSLRTGVDRAVYRARMWNAQRGGADDDMSPVVREQLRAHFRSDSEALRDLAGREVPWLSAWSQPRANRSLSAMLAG